MFQSTAVQPSANEIPSELTKKVVEYLLATPKALALALFSFLSGHLWIFLVLAYFKASAKGNNRLDNLPGKLGLGAAWYALILMPIYWIDQRTFRFDYDRILDLVPSTVVIGLGLQLVAFVVVTAKKGGR